MFDPHVNNHMKLWTCDLLNENGIGKITRSPTEPPIPGYQGFIPRVDNTEAGIGRRFHDAAHKGLQIFRKECNNHIADLACSANKIEA